MFAHAAASLFLYTFPNIESSQPPNYFIGQLVLIQVNVVPYCCWKLSMASPE